MTDQIWCLDATNRIHVLWYAMRHPARVESAFFAELDRTRTRFEIPVEKLGLAFDNGRTFRHDLHPDYKSDRKPKDQGLIESLNSIREHSQPSPTLWADGLEADDVLATVANACEQSGLQCVLISPDKDLFQCLRAGKVTVCRSIVFGPEITGTFYSASHLEIEFGFQPGRWIDFQTLTGDGTDSVKGWEGVGPVTARKWLAAHTLDEILHNEWLTEMSARQKRTRADFLSRAAVVRQLVTLRTNAPHVCDWI